MNVTCDAICFVLLVSKLTLQFFITLEIIINKCSSLFENYKSMFDRRKFSAFVTLFRSQVSILSKK